MASQKAQDLSTEEKTPKKSRTSLAETPRSRIYRSRSVKDTAKTPEKDRGAKSAPKTPKSGDKRKRSDTGENVFQAAHFDSESDASMVESDDEEELRRKKKIRKVRNCYNFSTEKNNGSNSSPLMTYLNKLRNDPTCIFFFGLSLANLPRRSKKSKIRP